MKMFLNIALIIISIIVIVSVMLQPSKSDGITSLISGGNENYFAKNKIRTYESTLAKVTMISAFFFALVVIALNIVK